MKITVVGTGYVGLVSGACLADFGHHVACVDTNEALIATLNKGELPIYEPGLGELIDKNTRRGRLSFTTELSQAVAGSTVVIIAVGTPESADGSADLSAVYSVARQAATMFERFGVIVTKSTVPVGTADDIERVVEAANPRVRIAVVSNPEFLREGAAIHDFKLPDRIVIGTDDAEARAVMTELYRPLYINTGPILFTGRRTAELIKYAANAFLATKITFINEIADLCEKVGANVQQVARGIGLDNRIGTKFLHPGPGFGGSCFPKDTVALVKMGEAHGTPVRIVEAVVAVNDQRKRRMVDRVAAALGGDVKGQTVAVLGLTFKPRTDDMREATSIPLVHALCDMGATVRAYDPAGMEKARAIFPGVTFCDDPISCAAGADALTIVTEWEEFRGLDLAQLRTAMRRPILIDLRNIYPLGEAERHGFAYHCIGRPSPT